MSFFPTKAYRFVPFLFALLLTFSCSKDSDLLADYVNPGSLDGKIRRFVVDDAFLAPANASIKLNVLANDTFPEDAEVQIKGTSNPSNGSVSINEDHSLTYSSDEPVESTDTFTYTTEVVNEDNTISSETGTVTVTLTDEKPPDVIMEELKAFPGAEGYGKNTSGGRGGTVYHVTNLNNSGSGSLRYGMESVKGARTIVFDISGYIDITTPLKIRDGYGQVSIAGETAPSPGICIRGASIWIHDGEVIIRYLKIRPGKDAYSPTELPSSDPNYEPDDALKIVAFAGDNINNVIIDHCSITWGNDENLSMNSSSSGSVSNVTIQNCLIAENVDKGYASLFDSNGTLDNLTVFRNLFANHGDRVPSFDTYDGDAEFVNNLVYGFERPGWISYGCRIDYVSNTYLSNPNITRINETIRLVSGGSGNIANTKVYIKDNTEDGSAITTNSELDPYLIDTRINNTGLPEVVSSQVQAAVLANAGNIFHPDMVDSRIKGYVTSLSGNLISHEKEVGGYPALAESTHPSVYDSDKDGMADSWETSAFGNLSKTASGDEDGNGFTNLEEFLYFLTL